jgi:KDO2-lipid IV(A) lauroyltransferase
MRARRVTMFGEDAAIPEGPLRLAQLTGAAILPMFSARVGYRSYVASFYPPRTVSREAKEQELDEIAQSLAGTLGGFLREHPTQWFHFGS